MLHTKKYVKRCSEMIFLENFSYEKINNEFVKKFLKIEFIEHPVYIDVAFAETRNVTPTVISIDTMQLFMSIAEINIIPALITWCRVIGRFTRYESVGKT